MRKNRKPFLFLSPFFLSLVFLSGCAGTAPQETSRASQEVSAEPEEAAPDSQAAQGGEEQEARTESEETSLNGFPEQMPDFTAKDLNGNTVTETIFQDKDLTVINIWGTFCPPCIGEMPELGEWAKNMPDQVQLVGLITDIQGEEDQEGRELAGTIVEKAGAEFTQIIANEDFYPVLQQVVGVPTTIFVDREGKLVGEPIIGAYVERYQEFVEEYLK